MVPICPGIALGRRTCHRSACDEGSPTSRMWFHVQQQRALFRCWWCLLGIVGNRVQPRLKMQDLYHPVPTSECGSGRQWNWSAPNTCVGPLKTRYHQLHTTYRGSHSKEDAFRAGGLWTAAEGTTNPAVLESERTLI